MNIILKAFVVGLVVYLGYYATFHSVLGRDDLSDKTFHLAHAQHPLTFTKGDYYAPLLHLIIYPLTLVMPVGLAFSIVVPIILFLFLPIAFVFAWSAFDFGNADVGDAQFYILFVAYLIPFCIFNCTWAQALNMVFVLMSLGVMFLNILWEKQWRNDLIDITLVVFVALGFFSHTEGGLWLLAIFLIYLLITKEWINLFVTITLIAVVAYLFPFMFARPHHLISTALTNLPFNFWEYLRIIILWINPITLLLVAKGMVHRFTEIRNDKRMLSCDILLASAVIMGLLSIPFDSEARSILSVMVLLGLYGAYGLRKSKLKIPFILWQIGWGALLAFGLVISRSM